MSNLSLPVPITRTAIFPHPKLPRSPCFALNHHPSPSKPPLPTLPFAQTQPVPSLKIRSNTGRAEAVAEEDSLSSITTELARGQEADGFPKTHHLPEHGLADRWREIHGRENWAGLLDPMDPLLRSELIRYGEMVQACYDSFDYDPFSLYCGSCKYNRRKFFSSLGMDHAGYEVTRYLYATSSINLSNFFAKTRGSKTWSERANWIGYVAVSGNEASARLGRRDIVVAWRGTVTKLEWVADLMDFLRPVTSEGIPCPDSSVKVESGFLELYTGKDPSCRFCKYSAREQVLTEVKKLVEQYTRLGEEVSITMMGHSLGSALAMLSAYDVVETGINVSEGRVVPVGVFSFAGPRVGNVKFKERFEGLGVKALRVVNVHDKVPKVPGIIVNEHVTSFVRWMTEGLPWSYSHVGVELALDHKNSPFLSETIDISCYHNLEAHLHLLDGYHGTDQRFVSASGRDPALVNKSCDFLQDHLKVPPCWRQDENKGMIRTADGRWVQPERPTIDSHPPDVHHHLRELGLVKDQEAIIN